MKSGSSITLLGIVTEFFYTKWEVTNRLKVFLTHLGFHVLLGETKNK